MATTSKANVEAVEVIAPPCTVCGSKETGEFIREARDYVGGLPGVFGLVRCSECRTVFTSPRPKNIGWAYTGFYSGGRFAGSVREESLGFEKILLCRQRVHLLNRLCDGKLKGTTATTLKLIDVGCSHGNFLLQCHKLCPSVQLEGCDMDEGALNESVAANVAKLFHTNSVDKPLGNLESDGYDVITLFHCLEHLEDPLAALKDARRVLKPGGLLFVEVPNYGSWMRWFWGRYWLPLLIPQHLTHFDRESLSSVVIKAGFKRDEIKKQNGMWTPTVEMTANAFCMLWHTILKYFPEGGMKQELKRIRTVNPLTIELIRERSVNPIFWLLAALELVAMGIVTVLDVPYALLLARTPYASHHFIAVQNKHPDVKAKSS